MRTPVHIACLQTQPKADFEAALTEALDLAAIAVEQGAQALFLPEYCGGLKTKGGMSVSYTHLTLPTNREV